MRTAMHNFLKDNQHLDVRTVLDEVDRLCQDWHGTLFGVQKTLNLFGNVFGSVWPVFGSMGVFGSCSCSVRFGLACVRFVFMFVFGVRVHVRGPILRTSINYTLGKRASFSHNSQK